MKTHTHKLRPKHRSGKHNQRLFCTFICTGVYIHIEVGQPWMMMMMMMMVQWRHTHATSQHVTSASSPLTPFCAPCTPLFRHSTFFFSFFFFFPSFSSLSSVSFFFSLSFTHSLSLMSSGRGDWFARARCYLCYNCTQLIVIINNNNKRNNRKTKPKKTRKNKNKNVSTGTCPVRGHAVCSTKTNKVPTSLHIGRYITYAPTLSSEYSSTGRSISYTITK